MDESKLEQLAIDTAKEVKRWGDTKTLGPMSARERRVIHVTLEADPEVVSESGEERPDGRKTVVIRLA
jgi:spoIIIJ-associated protein